MVTAERVPVGDPAGGLVFFLTESPPQAFLVAEIDGVVVGYIRLGSPLPLPENAHVIAVLGLAVAPGARRGEWPGHC